MTVLNTNNVDYTEQPMFFGEELGLQRYDKFKYPAFDKINKRMMGYFWLPEEVDLSKDKTDMDKLSDIQRDMFIKNLSYQILLDSVQGRAPVSTLLPIVSLPELEGCIITWDFFECLVEGTEVLTNNGWKDLQDVVIEDKVCQYNIEDGSLSFVNPSKVIKRKHKGKIINYDDGKRFTQSVTPNHRMPVVRRTSNKKYFELAENLDYNSDIKVPVSGNLFGIDSKLTALEALKIATQADGTLSDRYNGEKVRTVPIWFSFSKKRKIDRIIDIFNATNFEWIELSKDGEKRRFKINVPIEFVDSDWKTFEWVDYSKISHRWALEFINEISKWDGCIKPTSIVYSSINKSNVKTVQTIAHLCNKTAKFYKVKDDRKDSYKDIFAVNIMNKPFKDGQSIKRSEIDYDGMVGCLTVETGAFLIRYNGNISVTGNCIHSRSYTHIIQNLYPNPNDVFNNILQVQEIVDRAASVTMYYDKLLEAVRLYSNGGDTNNLSEMLMDALVAVNILEGVRFYVSFACAFALGESQLMEGNAKIIKFIARDEAMHLSLTTHMINLLVEREGYDKLFERNRDKYRHMYHDAANEEKRWAEFLFRDGSILGLSSELLGQYVEYIVNRRANTIGLGKIFDRPLTNNPLPWVDSWLGSKSNQPAPQETEITSYVVSSVKQDVNDEGIGELSL